MAAGTISKVAVIGTGQMGPGIAVATTVAGHETVLVGRKQDSLTRGLESYEAALRFLVAHEAITGGEADRARDRLSPTTDFSTLPAVDLVVESIVEDLPVKRAFFRELGSICPGHIIIASNTSGLRISDIAMEMRSPQRAVTTHFWNPAHLMPLVEVIQGERTSDETVDRVYAFLIGCGKRPVIGRKDVPGQICNRLLQAVIREAVYMVQQGIATPEGVDTAIKAGMGLRFPVWGPLEHIDAAGLDLAVRVQASVLPSLCAATGPGPHLQDLVRQGDLGAKTGRGFYDWTKRSMDDLKRTRDRFLVERYKESRGGARP